MLQIGDVIRNLRIKRGFEQEELAERAGISQSYISMVEGNKVNPSLKTLKKIAIALGVSEGELMRPPHEVALTEESILIHFDEETKTFLAKDKSVPFVTLAKELSEEGFTKEEIEALKQIIRLRQNKS